VQYSYVKFSNAILFDIVSRKVVLQRISAQSVYGMRTLEFDESATPGLPGESEAVFVTMTGSFRLKSFNVFP